MLEHELQIKAILEKLNHVKLDKSGTMLKKWQSLAIIMTGAEKKITEFRTRNHSERKKI